MVRLLVTITGVGDRIVTAGPQVSVGDLIDAVGGSKGQVMLIRRTASVLERSRPLDGSGLRSGDVIELRHRRSLAESATGSAPVTLTVLQGPALGAAYELTYGVTTIGRVETNDITIVDPGLSRRHAIIDVTRNQATVADNQSTNGVLLNGAPITEPTPLTAGDRLVMGETVVEVDLRVGRRPPDLDQAPPDAPTPETAEAGPSPRGRGRTRSARLAEFHRRARSFNRYSGSVIDLPAPPEPLNRWSLGRLAQATYERDRMQFEKAMASRAEQLREDQHREQERRRHESPSVEDVAAIVAGVSPRLWERTIGDPDLGHVRLGLADLPSRHRIIAPDPVDGELDQWITAFLDDHRLVRDVPMVVDVAGGLRLVGPQEPVTGLASSILVQLTGLASPGDLVVGALVGPSTAAEWSWLKWLPHARRGPEVVGADLLASTPERTGRLVEAVRALIDQRRHQRATADSKARAAAQTRSSMASANEPPSARRWPTLVLVVDEDASVGEDALAHLMDHGPAVDVHLLWLAVDQPRLPSTAPATTVTITGDGTTATVELPDRAVGDQRTSDSTLGDRGLGGRGFGDRALNEAVVGNVSVEACGHNLRLAVARNLAPIVDRSGWSEVDGLPIAPMLLHEIEADAATPAGVAARWRAGNAAAVGAMADRLPAVVGKTPHGPLRLELSADRPHALIVGDDTAGKTMLLETWVASLAAGRPPTQLEFRLFGAPHGDCRLLAACGSLPHVTESLVDPLQAGAALTRLSREVARRTELVALSEADSVAGLRRAAGSDTEPGGSGPEIPTDLVIVVDDLLAWAGADDNFASALVDLADRARHLGVYLIASVDGGRYGFFDLSPASVERIRSTADIRIALRLSDPAVSGAVIGSDAAVGIDRTTPGRGWFQSGADQPVPFQSARVCAPQLVDDHLDVADLTLDVEADRLRPGPDGPPNGYRSYSPLLDAITAAAKADGTGAVEGMASIRLLADDAGVGAGDRTAFGDGDAAGPTGSGTSGGGGSGGAATVSEQVSGHPATPVPMIGA